MQSTAPGIECRNPAFNSGLFSRRNIETTNGYEELSEIECEVNNVNLNAPTSSMTLGTVSNNMQEIHDRFSRNVNRMDFLRGNTESSIRVFHPSPRKSMLSSRLPLQDRSGLIQGGNFRRNNDFDGMSTSSRTFGLISRNDTGLLSNDRNTLNEESSVRSNGFHMNMSRRFGFGSKNAALDSGLFSRNDGRLNQEANFGSEKNFSRTSAMSRTFGLGSRNMGGGLLLQENERTNHELIITDYGVENNQSTSSVMSKTYGLVNRNTTLSSGLHMQDRLRQNEEFSEDGFRRPPLSRAFRSRNSTVPSRLFSSQRLERYCKDLSNINGFNTSHISKRDIDSMMSESRLQMMSKQNAMDNQSLSGSVLSYASAKAQFINVLENLHHSILSMAPNLPAEAVRMEFDKAKQGLESINEMSFAPAMLETDRASVTSHSSKYICPPVPSQTISTIPLQTGKDMLKSLTTKNTRNRTNLLLAEEEDRTSVVTASQKQASDDGNDDSAFVFKKPKPFSKSGRKSLRSLKIKTPQVKKNFKPKASQSKSVINLKQWYPVAFGNELAFCGVNDEGEHVQTEAVKKRINNRKVVLLNGLECNLIGSVSDSMVSLFPKKIISKLKDGLTCYWRVFGREILDHQSLDVQRKLMPRKKNEKKSAKSAEKHKTRQEDVEEVEIYENTPTTRGKKHVKQQKKKIIQNSISDTPLTKNVSVKTTLKGRRSRTLIKSPSVLAAMRAGRAKARRKKMEKGRILSEEVEKVSSVNESPKKSVSPKKNSSLRKSPRRESKSPKKLVSPGNNSISNKSPRKSLTKTVIRGSKSPKKSVSPKKKKLSSEASPKKNVIKRWESKETSPRKNAKGNLHTKSGRTVKPPKEFWLSSKNNEVTSSDLLDTLDSSTSNRSAVKKLKREESKVSREGSRKKEMKINEETEEVEEAHSSTEAKHQTKKGRAQAKRKREAAGDADSTQRKKSKSHKTMESIVESSVEISEEPTENQEVRSSKSTVSNRSKSVKERKAQQKNIQKRTIETVRKTVITKETEFSDFEGDDLYLQLDEIQIPEIGNISSKPQLNRSQLRLVSMETPPLKYFNNNLKILKNVTPAQSPDWCISQRTESEVKQFQRRRANAHKKKIKVDKKTVEEKKNSQSRDLRNVLDWVAEKVVRSPIGGSKVLQYVLPSRKKIIENEDDDDDDNDDEMEAEESKFVE